jgi:hypothetical protein
MDKNFWIRKEGMPGEKRMYGSPNQHISDAQHRQTFLGGHVYHDTTLAQEIHWEMNKNTYSINNNPVKTSSISTKH